jgi:hypothetical protein
MGLHLSYLYLAGAPSAAFPRVLYFSLAYFGASVSGAAGLKIVAASI